MNIHEALSRRTAERVIQRMEWPVTTVVGEMQGGDLMIYRIKPDGLHQTPWMPKAADILANDWQVVE